MPRLFIAIPASPEVRFGVSRIVEDFKDSGADFKWVEAQMLHLTLSFLGETSAEGIPPLEAAVERAAARPDFPIAFEGIGVFDSPDRPRVVWIGVGEGAGMLEELAAALPRPDRRPFRPHLTLGRMRSPRGLPKLREKLKAWEGNTVGLIQRAGRLVLYESRLTPQGPKYAPLKETEFRP